MVTKDLGMVTAYAYAVSKGYTGTEEEFAELMASYASVAQKAVDAALAAAQSAQAAESAKDTAQTTVDGAIAGIQAEGQTQIGAVQSEGTTQVGNVNAAGTTQVGAVQAKGTEVINSIPSDYTELSDDVSGLKSALNDKYEKPSGGIPASDLADGVIPEVPVQDVQVDGTSVVDAQGVADIPLGELADRKADVIIASASGSIASFSDGADDMSLKSCVVQIEPVQSGSGDPAPDNVRPITGWTGVNITRTGVNIWDEEWENGYWDTTTGQPVSNNKYIRCKHFIPVNPSTEYKFVVGGINIQHQLIYFNANKEIVGSVSVGPGITFTTPNNCYYLKFYLNWQYGDTYNNDVSINYPSTDLEYHNNPNAFYSISWQSEAGTVYGGYVDPVKGELVVTHKKVTYNGTENWTMDQTPRRFGIATTGVLLYNQKVLSDYFSPKITSDQTTWGYFSYYYDRAMLLNDQEAVFSSLEEFKSWMGEHTPSFVYKLSAPITYQLGPNDLKTLLGQNDIWADCGDTAVQYPADTKLYIEQLTTPTEDDLIADHAIASGTFFMIGNNLYLATAAIANGATITPGTNATKMSLADALNTLNT